MSLTRLLFDAAPPERTAIISPIGALSYRELFDDIRRVAARLDLSPGAVVGVHLPNGADFAVAFHAVLCAGGVVTPIPMTATDADVSYQVSATGAVMVITATELARLRALPPIGEISGLFDAAPTGLACLPMSSGTTGLPKAVMLTHRNLVANTMQFAQVVPISPGERCLSVLPFSHIYGLTALLHTPLFLGATVIAQPFAAESFIQAHEQHGVNVTFIAPPLATLLARHPLVDRTDFSSLHTIINGAAALPAATGEVVEKRTGARVIQGYGMTEAAPVTHLAQRGDTPMASIGSVVPGTETRVVDPETSTESARGELWVRGPQVMAGYLGDAAATAATLVDGGWLRTGDIVARDGEEFFVVDRLKDIIKSHGVQVSPQKLENIILTIPGVLDCAVVRGFGADGEEQPVAVIVGDVPAAVVMETVASRVTPAERIRQVRFADSIPRSASGKILRRLMQDG